MKKLMIVLLLCTALLLTACGSKDQPANNAQQPACADVAKAILASQDFTKEMGEMSQARALRTLGLDADSCADLYMAMDLSSTTPETVIVITAKDDATAANVISSKLESYRREQLAKYETYRIAEAPKLETAVFRNGTQCVLVFCADHDKAAAAIAAMWK